MAVGPRLQHRTAQARPFVGVALLEKKFGGIRRGTEAMSLVDARSKHNHARSPLGDDDLRALRIGNCAEQANMGQDRILIHLRRLVYHGWLQHLSGR